MNNVASKIYSTHSNALRAMRNKVNYIHGCEKSGEVNFGRLYVEGETLFAESSYWEASTLQDFLDNKSKLVQ